MSFVNLSLFIAAKYTNLTETGPQILSSVSEIINKIDNLDNPEIRSEDIFNEIDNMFNLLQKSYITEIHSAEVLNQMQSIGRLLHSRKCIKDKTTSKRILEVSNNLIKNIDENNPGVSASNILHKISSITKFLEHSKITATNEQVTDLKIVEEMKKFVRIMQRPEIEISSAHILDLIKDLLQVLQKVDEHNVNFEKDLGSGDKAVACMKELRLLLKKQEVHLQTSQLLFEIKGMTDILNRSDLEMASAKEQKKILGSMGNLRKKLKDFNDMEEEHDYSEEVVEEINGLLSKVNIKSYEYDKKDHHFKKKIE